jgi:hypothetical protein
LNEPGKVLSRAVYQANTSLELLGIQLERPVRAEVSFKVSDKSKAFINIRPSAVTQAFDKARVETPFASVVFSKEFIQSATKDGMAHVFKLEPVASLPGGVKIQANKKVDGWYGVSLKPNKSSSIIKDEAGMTIPSKLNPTRKELEFAVDGEVEKAAFSKPALPGLRFPHSQPRPFMRKWATSSRLMAPFQCNCCKGQLL